MRKKLNEEPKDGLSLLPWDAQMSIFKKIYPFSGYIAPDETRNYSAAGR